MPGEDLDDVCRQAGPVTTLAALITVYRQRCAEMAAAGQDPFLPLAALELVLVPRVAEVAS